MGIYLLDNKQVTFMYTVSQIGNCSHRKKLLFSNGVSLVCKGYLSADPLTRNISPTQMNSKVFFGGFSSHNAVLGLLALKKIFVVFIYMLWFPVLCFYIIPLYANGKTIQSHTSFVGPCTSALVIKNKET